MTDEKIAAQPELKEKQQVGKTIDVVTKDPVRLITKLVLVVVAFFFFCFLFVLRH
jgi:hypothetical protein